MLLLMLDLLIGIQPHSITMVRGTVVVLRMCANENKPLVARIGVQPVAADTTFAARTAILPLTAGVHRTVATDDLSGRTSCTGQKCRPIAVLSRRHSGRLRISMRAAPTVTFQNHRLQ